MFMDHTDTTEEVVTPADAPADDAAMPADDAEETAAPAAPADEEAAI